MEELDLHHDFPHRNESKPLSLRLYRLMIIRHPANDTERAVIST
jgi:hypothetical protein